MFSVIYRYSQEALVRVRMGALDLALMLLLQLSMSATLAHVTLRYFIPAYVRAWRRKWKLTSVFLRRKFHGWSSENEKNNNKNKKKQTLNILCILLQN